MSASLRRLRPHFRPAFALRQGPHLPSVPWARPPLRTFSSAGKPAAPSLAEKSRGALAMGMQVAGVVTSAAARTAPLISKVLKAEFVQMWVKQGRRAVGSATELMGAQYKSYVDRYFSRILFVGAVTCLYYTLRITVNFLETFLHNVESSFWHFLRLSGVLVAVLAAMHVIGRFHLSASHVHKMATHIVAISAEPAIIARLGSRITTDSMRIVTRSGGNMRLVWPETPKEERRLAEQAEAQLRAKAAQTTAATAADNEAAPASSAVEDSSSDVPVPAPSVAVVASTGGPGAKLIASARRKLAKLRLESKILMARLHIPHVEYLPQRAHLVFPVSGKEGKAMVSVQVVKHAGGLNGLYTFQLVALDFVDNSYCLLYGDDERYNSEVAVQLRMPMVTWMKSGDAIEAEVDADEARDDAKATADRAATNRRHWQAMGRTAVASQRSGSAAAAV